ncbi:molybdopterin-guanine dinucleotide biosynthesis protein B [Staphylococcus xylosus]|uniref:molybdopterin-guanine dinucleotide biosynthesis protein B n=1 Tax=Staphylococcus xylosus TaxID=1288 RepID=UPI00085C2E35|nr:molybdopterin-guanine dinucleotide biosynthesis protein B [Staphylococcus xylosus]SCU03063.1 molybdopterin-guanine dinucleotide biosynthesis protein B [Staphylococcus xylosus]
MILQIVGFKNSGKTTLMTHTIKLLKAHDLTVATIKHHGQHQQDFQDNDITLQKDYVDHMKHFHAGADQSIVQGNLYQQTVTRTEKQSLDEIINESVTIDNNIILVEGFKNAGFDKVAVYTDENERKSLGKLSNVQYYMKMNDINAMEQYDNWLLTYFKIKGMH